MRKPIVLSPTCQLIVLLLALLLVSCGGAEAPEAPPTAPAAEEPAGEATQAVTEPVQEEGEEVEVTRVVVTEGVPGTVQTPALTAPAATQAPPLATAPAIEEIAEVEWPGRMRLGESDVVRLALLPVDDGYVVSAEFPEHETITETVALEQLAGYDVIATARLDGVGFSLAPRGDQPQNWQPERQLTWRWTISPRRSGQQRLSLALTIHWRPEAGRSLPSRQLTTFSRALDVEVVGPLGLSNRQMLALALVAGVLALAAGFPLLRRLRRRGHGLERAQPDPALRLEPHPELALDSEEQALLRALFRGYSRVTVESEFQSGYSGARTFLALPIRGNGRADAYTIAKLGAREAILREYENYETYVEHTLPPVTARIQGQPVTVNGRRTVSGSNGAKALAALRYTFIGAPGEQPLSLRQALLDGGEGALLESLFRTFGPNWWMQRRPYTFRLATEYDCKLPAHAVLAPANGPGKALDGRLAPAEVELETGQLISLRRFHVVARKWDDRAVKLQGEAQSGQPPLRLHWMGPPPSNGAVGRVVATREEFLQERTAGFAQHGLPDPLARLPALLAKTVVGSRSIIHGDLNVENVLVGPGDFVWLIDFASTREGHTLFDFAHLGAELVAHVLSRRYTSAGDYLVALQAGQEPLLNKLEQIASRCLADPDRPQEYRLPLVLSCLGALKHKNVDERASEFLYITAAHLIQRDFAD
ncbi:MAG: phosphotransferase [Chloroflexota bacterium]